MKINMTRKRAAIAVLLVIGAIAIAGNITTDNITVNQVATITQLDTPVCPSTTFPVGAPRQDNWNPACLATNTVQQVLAGDNNGTWIGGIDAIDHGPSTTIAPASDSIALPQATINVVSTAGWSAFNGTYLAYVTTTAGQQTVTCTVITSTTFGGCTGGVGTMATGNAVLGGFPVGTIRTICNMGATTDAGSVAFSMEDANSQPNNRIWGDYFQSATFEDRFRISTASCATFVYSQPDLNNIALRRWIIETNVTGIYHSMIQNLELFPRSQPVALTGTNNDYNPNACGGSPDGVGPINGNCEGAGSTLFEDYSFAVLTTANASTTIAALSDGATLPQATINVASTTTFTGATTHIYLNVTSTTGVQYVICTGQTGTTFTGCTGGAGVIHTGGAVTSIEVLTGMVGPGGNTGKGQGQIKVLDNSGPGEILITSGDLDSASQNRFVLPNNQPIVLHQGDTRMFITQGGQTWIPIGVPLSLQGTPSSAGFLIQASLTQPVSPNRLSYSNVFDNGVATQVGAVSFMDSSSQTNIAALRVEPAGTGVTVTPGQYDSTVLDTRSWDTTAGALSVGGLAVTMNVSRSAGASTISPVALALGSFTTNGTAYALTSNGGIVYWGLGNKMATYFMNSSDTDASDAMQVETTFSVGGGDFTGSTHQEKCAQSTVPTANHGTLAADSGNCIGEITGIGANTAITLTYGGGGFATSSHCTATVEGATAAVITVTPSNTAPVFNCFDMAGVALNCPDFTYHCWGH